MKNILNKKLEVCSLNPITGYNRDGFCRPDETDFGKHLVCAEMNKAFLDFTERMGNDLRSVVKEGQKWCLCEDRYYEAYLNKKAPVVIKHSTHKNIKSEIKNSILNSGKKKTKKYNSKKTKAKKSIKKKNKKF